MFRSDRVVIRIPKDDGIFGIVGHLVDSSLNALQEAKRDFMAAKIVEGGCL